MRFHSSIFSFDTLRLKRHVPGGLIIALLILLAIEFGISRADWPYRRLGPSYVKEFLSVCNRASTDAPAELVILGNSRSQCGLLASELERALTLPAGSVRNYSLRTGDHYDNHLFYARSHASLRRASILVYAIDAYQWNAGFPLSERFNHFAGLTERWDLQRTPQCLFGYFFRTSQKGPLYRAMLEAFAERHRRRLVAPAPPSSVPAPAPAAAAPPAFVPMSLDALQGLDPAGNLIETWYDQFRLCAPREALLRNILASAARDGQRVILVQMPFRDAYMRALQASHAAEYRAYLDAVEALPNVDVIVFEDAAHCDLSDADFLDWNHLNEAGAAKFARCFADRLRGVEREQLARRRE